MFKSSIEDVYYEKSPEFYIQMYGGSKGGNGLPHFSGEYRGGQSGLGLFSNLVNFAMPFVRRFGRNLANVGLSTASEIIGDLQSGKKLSSSLKKRAPAAIKKAAIKTLRGKGKKRRTKVIKPKMKKKKGSKKKKTVVKRKKAVKKRKKKSSKTNYPLFAS